MSEADRKRLHLLRRRVTRSLSPSEEAELEGLFLKAEDDRWAESPWYGPGGADGFALGSRRRSRGRPRTGVTAPVFDRVVETAREWTGPKPPSQAWVGGQLSYASGEPEPDAARQVRRILRATGYRTWAEFVASRWAPRPPRRKNRTRIIHPLPWTPDRTSVASWTHSTPPGPRWCLPAEWW